VRLFNFMRVLLFIIILAIIAQTADARRRHHHRHHLHRDTYAQMELPGLDRGDRFSARAERRSNIAGLVPRDWQLERADAARPSNRFVSSAGTAWVEFYARSAEAETSEERFKAVAFADHEEITYLRGERNWLAVSGIRGDRIFYRKVVLACGERQWRHIALEYPADEKRQFDRLVSRMSRALDRAREEDCLPPATESTPPVE
jgi:serine/threonine-protein kinase